MTENVAVLLAALVAALAGVVVTGLDSRSERQRRVRRTDRANSQPDFVERWLDLRERVLATEQTPPTIDQDLMYAYDQAVRAERADIQPPKRSLCLRAEAWRDRRHARSREAERPDGTSPVGLDRVPQRLPPAGWYPSPDGPGCTWWDGQRWTVPRQDAVPG